MFIKPFCGQFDSLQEYRFTVIGIALICLCCMLFVNRMIEP